MFKDKFLLSIIIGTVTLLSLGIVLVSNSSSGAKLTESNSEVITGVSSHDWGTIDMNDGVVKKTFSLTNEGEGTLELANVKTSCACTYAIITVNGKKSPQFGMHSVSSWTGKVEPGEEAQVEVVFDPAFHGPQGVGAISRQVTIETNDKSNPAIEFNLTANVINAQN